MEQTNNFIPVSIGIFLKDESNQRFAMWTQERQEEGHLKGKWEFPGGKIEIEESPITAIKREITEEVEYTWTGKERVLPFKEHSYRYQDRSIRLFVFIIKSDTFDPSFGKWLEINCDDGAEKVKDLIPAANIPIVEDLCKYFKSYQDNQRLTEIWNLSAN